MTQRICANLMPLSASRVAYAQDHGRCTTHAALCVLQFVAACFRHLIAVNNVGAAPYLHLFLHVSIQLPTSSLSNGSRSSVLVAHHPGLSASGSSSLESAASATYASPARSSWRALLGGPGDDHESPRVCLTLFVSKWSCPQQTERGSL